MSQATILIRKTTDIPSIEETSRRIHALIDMISEDFAIK